MGNILFNFDDGILMEISEVDLLRSWLNEILVEKGINNYELNYVFCSDEKILKLNNEFLNHDYHTDIITFDLSEEPNHIIADMYVSVDTVKKNSIIYDNSFNDEMCRVLIHGVLHLLGFDDKEVEDQENMRKHENLCLNKLFHVKQQSIFNFDVSRENYG